MFNEFCHRRVCSIIGTSIGRIWDSVFSIPEYRSWEHHHYADFSSLSPIEEARLRYHSYLELRQW